MRLDKFLKVSRLIKRRTVAKEVCDGGKASINGRVAKAGTEVQIGDVIQLQFGAKIVRVRVVDIKETVRADAADSLYEVLND